MKDMSSFFFFQVVSSMWKDNQAKGVKKKKKNEVMKVTSSLECLEMASGNLEVTPKESGRVSYA